jgi:peptidase inhibitor family I36
MIKVLRQALVVLVAVGVLLGIGATAASASWNSCPAGERVCTYSETFGNGSNYNYSFTYVNNCINIGYPWNDAIQSLWNRSSHEVMFYLDANCSNGSFNRWLWWPGEKETASGAEYSSLRWVS